MRTRTGAPDRFLKVWSVAGEIEVDWPGPSLVQMPLLITSSVPSITSYSSVKPVCTWGGGETDPGGSLNSISTNAPPLSAAAATISYTLPSGISNRSPVFATLPPRSPRLDDQPSSPTRLPPTAAITPRRFACVDEHLQPARKALGLDEMDAVATACPFL